MITLTSTPLTQEIREQCDAFDTAQDGDSSDEENDAACTMRDSARHLADEYDKLQAFVAQMARLWTTEDYKRDNCDGPSEPDDTLSVLNHFIEQARKLTNISAPVIESDA